ncbi:Argonaute [Rhynchospora pubera]|uniref:Argonaute n=1 Tax=Rhynchospora pubera TaxID=906938 RepID=A0AAV8DSG7_9POAL|nr:Argonaute [Rhynchospora pubera]
MDHGEDLSAPPPISSDVEPIQGISDKGASSRSQPLKGNDRTSKPKMILATRPGQGKRGEQINLLCNHFGVKFRGNDESFYQYSVLLQYEDGSPVVGKGIGRKVVEKMKQAYGSLLGNKPLAYDGEKTLFSLGTLSPGTPPQNEFNFDVVLEDLSSGRTRRGSPGGSPACDDSGGSDRKRLRKTYSTKTFKVVLKLITEIPISVFAQAMKGHESKNTQEAFRVLDVILRQHSAAKGCLLVRQSFFHNNPNNFIILGGGVMGCPGFHSSFCKTQSGVSLNIDVSTTTIVKPGPVIDFLMDNQSINNNPNQIDWQKAKRVLKNLRIRYLLTNQEYKIIGLSDLPCGKQTFMLKLRNGGGEKEVTVSQYYMEKKINLRFDKFPCINVGKPTRPTFFPPELCHLVSLQRYTKALNSLQRASLVENSRQRPLERMRILNDARGNYDSEPMLRASGISISSTFVEVDGRVLPAPKLLTGNGVFVPRDGRWNFNNKTLYKPCVVDEWAVVNFSAQCNVKNLIQSLIRCGQMKGVKFDQHFYVIEEEHNMQGKHPNVRVDEMFKQLQRKLPGDPRFLLCLLPKRKNSDIYGPWKRKCLADRHVGIVTQCLAPTRVNDQYLTNLLLKINVKLGGMNSILQIENPPSSSLICKVPTIILGLDVSHGSPGQSDHPSIAAVVSSRKWPLISKYRASVHAQSARLEMIDSLFKPKGTDDFGIFRELLEDFLRSSEINIKPNHVIIFRDGVSESQFNQVLNIELDQIMAACKFLDDNWNPKFTVIVAQKNHHTRFFIPNSQSNLPPGTVIDKKVCHPRNYDFYLCSHKGAIGTSRPTHYHVLLDQIGFEPDDLHDLIHSLSYIYQRSTTAVSVVAPIYYAHLAAAQVAQFMKFDDNDTSSSQGGQSSEGTTLVPELPHLHKDVRSSMFFC